MRLDVKEAPNTIFVPDLTLELTGANFNHCSTICSHKNGILIAWYGGTNECNDDQSVFLLYIDKNGISKPLQLGTKTGNPVLWNEGNKSYLLWSRFEDTNAIKTIADRWKYCSLWMVQIDVEGDEIRCIGDAAYINIPHLLGRCNPITWRGKTFIPLYDEVNRHGVILAGRDLQFSRYGTIGENMIQPAIWVDDRICSLSRTFHSIHRNSQFSYSGDGIIWSPPELSEIPNRNSSLAVLVWNGYPLLLWNDTKESYRTNLTLGIIEGGVKVRRLLRVNQIYGSYPSLCEDINGNLCFSYTSFNRTIIFNTWYKEQLLQECRGGDFS